MLTSGVIRMPGMTMMGPTLQPSTCASSAASPSASMGLMILLLPGCSVQWSCRKYKETGSSSDRFVSIPANQQGVHNLDCDQKNMCGTGRYDCANGEAECVSKSSSRCVKNGGTNLSETQGMWG